MKKKISVIFLVLIIFFFLFACSFSSYATVNEIGNFMNGTKNMMENTMDNAGNMIKNGTNSMSNAVDNFVGGMFTDQNNNTTNQNSNLRNNTTYTAQRTSVSPDDVTVAGINANVWTWIIIAVTIVGIATLLWSYFMQKNRSHSDYYNE